MKHNMDNYEETYRDFQWKVPEDYNFAFDVVDRWAETEDKLAMISVEGDGKTAQKDKFSDLRRESNKFANILIDLGVAKGDCVLIMVPRLSDWYYCMLGMMKVGAIPMPATSLLRPHDIEYRLNRSDGIAVITTADQVEKVDEIAGKCPTLKQKIVIGGKADGWVSYEDTMKNALETLDQSRVEPTKSTDPMLLYFTSGTTGEPKMVIHNGSYAIGHTVTARFCQDLRKDDIHWTIADTGWAKTAWGKFFGQWIQGAAFVQWNVEGRFDADLAMGIIQGMGVTTFCAPPTIYRMFILQDLSKYDFSNLRHCMSAGEPLNPEVINQWEAATGTTIYDFYGQTETVCLVSNFPCMPIKAGSMGKPTPGHNVVLLDEEHNEVELTDETGQIAVKLSPERPPGLFKEYWKDPEKNEAVFIGDYYLTGDKAYRDTEGYFWFVGRADDVFKASGYRIGPFEVESALIEHAAVAEAAVIGAPDELRGLVVKAFIKLAPGFEASEELTKELQTHVKNVTAPYKYPRQVEYLDEFPKTISGKIKRAELRRQELEKFKAEKKG